MSLWNRIAEDIFVYDQFVRDHELAIVEGLSLAITDWNDDNDDMWKQTTCGADILFNVDPLAYLTLENIARRVLIDAESLFSCKLLFREPSLVRYTNASSLRLIHADKENLDGSPKIGMEDYDVSAVVYYNSGFVGGDLVFPQHDVRVVPSPGKVVMFPGAATHLHFVDTIVSGERWSTPLFFSIAK